MTDKSLQEKAISIRGKDYVQVKDRINYFNEMYPTGCIQTSMISDDDKVVFKAKVIPDITTPDRYFTGTSASNPSKTIEAQVPHEVAETSAVGRALAMMGIGVIDSVASVDEMNKASYTSNTNTTASQPSASKQAEEVTCQYHKVKMFKTPKMKSYAHKDEIRGWCNGQGYADEKDAWREKTNAERK